MSRGPRWGVLPSSATVHTPPTPGGRSALRGPAPSYADRGAEGFLPARAPQALWPWAAGGRLLLPARHSSSALQGPGGGGTEALLGHGRAAQGQTEDTAVLPGGAVYGLGSGGSPRTTCCEDRRAPLRPPFPPHRGALSKPRRLPASVVLALKRAQLQGINERQKPHKRLKLLSEICLFFGHRPQNHRAHKNLHSSNSETTPVKPCSSLPTRSTSRHTHTHR